MDHSKKSITSAHLALRFQTASLVLAPDETHIVFPALDFERKEDRPPRKNLNTDRDGPQVVRVDVHQIGIDEGRSGYFGHSGVERVSLFLPPEQFSELARSVQQLRDNPTIEAGVEVDADGNVVRLTINGRSVIIVPSSGTRSVGSTSEPRTGTD